MNIPEHEHELLEAYFNAEEQEEPTDDELAAIEMAQRDDASTGKVCQAQAIMESYDVLPELSDPRLPTQTRPGTVQRLAVLAKRAQCGLPLWIEGDRDLHVTALMPMSGNAGDEPEDYDEVPEQENVRQPVFSQQPRPQKQTDGGPERTELYDRRLQELRARGVVL
jgi:hypothetical protein